MEEIIGNIDSQTFDLRSVVKANEDIKKVVRISSDVNLVALNAMLVAKRSGVRSRGFAVISSELRVFSQKLEGAMSGLGTLIFGLVQDAAAMQKQRNERRLLHITMAQGHRMRELVAHALVLKDENMRETADVIRQDWHRLRLQLGSVLQLCETGGFLSRCARIETVYGGVMSANLKQVACQIEEPVSEILSTLKLLRTQLAA